MTNRIILLLAAAVTAAAVPALGRSAAEHDPHQHGRHDAAATTPDMRTLVQFPEALRTHTLANMRDHLLALQEIHDALADGRFEVAGEIAERRLGMSSLERHGAHEVATYMPEGMQAAGTEMHRAASRFAVAANDAAVTGDMKPVVARLGRVVQQCVACHSSYRLQ